MKRKLILFDTCLSRNTLRLFLVGIGISISGCGGETADSKAIADQRQEIIRLRAENQELPQLRKINEEVQRLKNENRDLAKLRGQAQELARLRADNEQLKSQLAKVQAMSR
ncbi:MAG: hypothetical protein O2960_17220 [Verrucomicrobia bacterium]|nr:hypothetical protein [Verrucomicrobiota bacterium]